MLINEKNLNLINDLEKELKEQLIWLCRNGIEQTSGTIERYRNLRQFIIGLSVAIIGVVFPITIASEIFTNNSFFIISLICFSYIVIYGILHLAISTTSELVEMPSVIETNLQLLGKMIKQVQDIRKIKNNDEAGKKYNELKSEYTKKFPAEKVNFFQKLWRKYESSFFFGF